VNDLDLQTAIGMWKGVVLYEQGVVN